VQITVAISVWCTNQYYNSRSCELFTCIQTAVIALFCTYPVARFHSIVAVCPSIADMYIVLSQTRIYIHCYLGIHTLLSRHIYVIIFLLSCYHAYISCWAWFQLSPLHSCLLYRICGCTQYRDFIDFDAYNNPHWCLTLVYEAPYNTRACVCFHWTTVNVYMLTQYTPNVH
jgi:hypothetical protein